MQPVVSLVSYVPAAYTRSGSECRVPCLLGCSCSSCTQGI